MEQPYFRSCIQRVKEAAAEKRLWAPGDTIVVAVSGGPDSMALLHVMHEISSRMPLQLICAHVHHGFRKESDEEAELVRTTAEELGIPFEAAFIDVPAYMKESGKGTQEAARDKRYEFLFQVAEAYGADSIALAHHADDQAETILMRIIRGTSPSGLAGMKFSRIQKNVKLIRPFLRINKADLVRLCEERRYPYAVDASNLQAAYHRNAIRLEVLPFLEQYNHQISPALIQLGELAGEEDDFMERAADEAYRSIVKEMKGGLAFSAPSFLGLHVALQRRLIKLILNYLSAAPENTDFNKIERAREAISHPYPTNWHLALGGGIECAREYGMVSFRPIGAARAVEFSYSVKSGLVKELNLPEIGKVLQIELMDSAAAAPSDTLSEGEALFDAERLEFPLTVRSRCPGDKIKVMGLNGSKKVKDILIDEKIPPSDRPYIPMVCDASGHIVWIPGIRRSAHAAVGQDSNHILRMKLLTAEKA